MRWNRKQLREHTEKETAALQQQNQKNIAMWAEDVKRLDAAHKRLTRHTFIISIILGILIGFVVTAVAYGSFVSYKLRTPEGTDQLKKWLVFQEK